MKRACLIVLCLLALSCTKDRGWDNPYDPGGTAKPTALLGLKAVALNDSTIELTWQDGENEIGYRIARSIDGGPMQEIGSVSQDDTRFADTGLKADHHYSYRVKAFTANKQMVYANTELQYGFAPSNLVLTQVSASEIRLEWKDNSVFESGFRIERKEGPVGEYVQIATVGPNSQTYTDFDVRLESEYTYRMCAFTPSNESAYSRELDLIHRLVGSTTTVDLPGGATMEMVWIQSGTFTMGSPSSEPSRKSNEGPQHEVTITKGFYLGRYELTQGQWNSVIPRRWEGRSYMLRYPNHPAVYISWNDVQAFIAKLNEAEGSEVYRLPTEAEWEYSCRAGATTRWSFGDDESQLGDYAWYYDNAWDMGEKYAHEVGMKLPNLWGLYDVHGNVNEWVQDWHGSYSSRAQTDPTGPASGSGRVVRGGSFGHDTRVVRSGFKIYIALDMRSADRGKASPDFFGHDIGARLLRHGH